MNETAPGVAGALTVPAWANAPVPSARSIVKLLSPVRELKLILIDEDEIAVADTPRTGSTVFGVVGELSSPHATPNVARKTAAAAAKRRVGNMRIGLMKREWWVGEDEVEVGQGRQTIPACTVWPVRYFSRVTVPCRTRYASSMRFFASTRAENAPVTGSR